MAAQELRWLTYLLTDLGEPPRSPPVLYVDNKAMLALCREQRLEYRTKHIALCYFLARELQQRGQLRLAYVASEANTADVFTKALAPCDHQRFCTQLVQVQRGVEGNQEDNWRLCLDFLFFPHLVLMGSSPAFAKSAPSACIAARCGAPSAGAAASCCSPSASVAAGVTHAPIASISPPPFIGGALLFSPSAPGECAARLCKTPLAKLFRFATRQFLFLRHCELCRRVAPLGVDLHKLIFCVESRNSVRIEGANASAAQHALKMLRCGSGEGMFLHAIGFRVVQPQLAWVQMMWPPRSSFWVFPVTVVNLFKAQGDKVDELLRITTAVGNAEVEDVNPIFEVRSPDLLARFVQHRVVEQDVACLGVEAEVDSSVHELRRRENIKAQVLHDQHIVQRDVRPAPSSLENYDSLRTCAQACVFRHGDIGHGGGGDGVGYVMLRAHHMLPIAAIQVPRVVAHVVVTCKQRRSRSNDVRCVKLQKLFAQDPINWSRLCIRWRQRRRWRRNEKRAPLHSASSTRTASSSTPSASTSSSRVSSSNAFSSSASNASASSPSISSARVSSSSSSRSSASSVSASSSRVSSSSSSSSSASNTSASSSRVSSSSSSSSSASSASASTSRVSGSSASSSNASSARVSSSRVSNSSASNTTSSGSSSTSSTSTSKTSRSSTSSSSSNSSTSKTSSSSTSSSSASSGRASSSWSATPKACALSKPLAQLLR
ncbi:unnamed protein product [Closterium sp. NIES-54]